jgi:DNA-binding CsgD family transcriptional regulator
VAAYKTSKEIADELFISVRTVDRHRANITTKLDLRGTHALLQFALEHKSQL